MLSYSPLSVAPSQPEHLLDIQDIAYQTEELKENSY